MFDFYNGNERATFLSTENERKVRGLCDDMRTAISDWETLASNIKALKTDEVGSRLNEGYEGFGQKSLDACDGISESVSASKTNVEKIIKAIEEFCDNQARARNMQG